MDLLHAVLTEFVWGGVKTILEEHISTQKFYHNMSTTFLQKTINDEAFLDAEHTRLVNILNSKDTDFQYLLATIVNSTFSCSSSEPLNFNENTIIEDLWRHVVSQTSYHDFEKVSHIMRLFLAKWLVTTSRDYMDLV